MPDQDATSERSGQHDEPDEVLEIDDVDPAAKNPSTQTGGFSDTSDPEKVEANKKAAGTTDGLGDEDGARDPENRERPAGR